MKFFQGLFSGLVFSTIFMSCNDASQQTNATADTAAVKGSYAYDADFLKKHTTGVVELTGSNGQSKVLLSAALQGRVMTSATT